MTARDTTAVGARRRWQVTRHATRALLLAVVAATVTLHLGRAAFGAEGEGEPHAAAQATAEGHEAAAHEASEHEATAPSEATPSIDGKKLGLQLLNFGVLVFVLVWFGGSAINKALSARHHQLKADLAAASELRAAAEAKLARQEARLGSLEQEIAELRRGIKAEAEAEKARLIAAAEERAQRIKAETAFLVEQQVRVAEVRLRRESAAAALAAAEEILRRSIGSADQQNLMNTFITDVETPAATTKAATTTAAVKAPAPASATAPGSGSVV